MPDLSTALSSHSLLGPMAVLALLTTIAYLLLVMRRIAAIKAGTVDATKYTTYQNLNEPAPVVQASRHVSHLFEMPVLFYVGCLASQIYGVADDIQLYLAWAYVGLRVLHSAIHLTYNHVMHRFYAFLASFAVLVALWARLALTL